MLTPPPPPRPLSSFVGRRAELDELASLIAQRRLVTLTGPGGGGKTRLAIEVASSADTAAYADLTAVQDAPTVRETVSVACGLGGQPATRLADVIADARLLLVIDNAEHVLDSVAALAQDLLSRCANLHMLVTSREVLDVDGAVNWRVPSLRLPPAVAPGVPMDLDQCGRCDAIALFCTRAREHLPTFRLDQDNAELVVRLCQALEGIPLALELAAARTRSMGLADIVARLDDSLALLTRGSRTAIARHRTLRATLDWSHDLLDEPDRRLLWRLAVFAGTFDLGAVAAICPDPDLPANVVTDGLQRLVDRSLVRVHPGPEGAMRYSLAEVVRQYARERLGEAEESELRARHAACYADLVRHLDTGDGDEVSSRLERLSADYDNVRLAMDWAAAEDWAMESDMLDHLRWFWRLRGLQVDALERFRSVLSKEPSDPARRALLHLGVGTMLHSLGDAEATANFDRAVQFAEEAGDAELTTQIFDSWGIVKAKSGDFEGAERSFLRAIQALENQRPKALLMITLNNLATLRLICGRPQDALEAIERAVGLKPQVIEWSEWAHGAIEHTHGAILLTLDCADEARDRFLAGLRVAIDHQNHGSVVVHLEGLACVAARAGEPVVCLELLAAAHPWMELARGSHHHDAGNPVAEAERTSRLAVGERAADEAWSRSLRMNLPTALERARQIGQAARHVPLTPRKLAIVRLVAAGLSNKEIAARLTLSVRSVEAHLDQARARLGFPNRARLAAWAVAQGLVEPADGAPG